jgi:hypothetical protein
MNAVFGKFFLQNRLRTILFFLVLLPGCSVHQVSQGIYAGAQTRNQLLSPPSERLEKEDYSTYGDYEHQRDEIIMRDSGSSATVP